MTAIGEVRPVATWLPNVWNAVAQPFAESDQESILTLCEARVTWLEQFRAIY